MKTIFSCFFCLFCLFTIGCTHQSSQENCVEIGSADAICVSTDTLGKTVRMNMLHGHYTTESEEVFAIVLNPQKLPLSYGRRWILERWENNQWVRLWTKKPTVFFDDEIIPITPPNIIVSVFLLNTIKQLPANIVFPHQCGMIWRKSISMLNLK